MISFLEKIERKNYKKPLEDIEDICGIRVICYYQSDVEKICSIIKKEFDIKEGQDKEELLNEDQFGYRSYHFIGKIKNKWLEAPNYRGLNELKFEIQVRTILMHSWAEIEHKLAYKQKIHIPKHLKRKLYRISAKLEEADEQFEEIKNESVKYRLKIIEDAKRAEGEFNPDINLDLDTLQAFLDVQFPKRKKDISSTRNLLNEIHANNISFKKIIESIGKISPFIEDIEKDVYDSKKKVNPNEGWVQVGIMRMIFDLSIPRYWKKRQHLPEYVIERKEKWKKIINTEPNKA